MNTRVKERETKGITIEGIHKVRGKNVYVDRKDGLLYSVRISLSSVNPKQYWGIARIHNPEENIHKKHTWILSRRERTLSIYKGSSNKPFYSKELTPNDLKTPDSLRNLIGDNVWGEWEYCGIFQSQTPAPYQPYY